jgi:hypothetical protein
MASTSTSQTTEIRRRGHDRRRRRHRVGVTPLNPATLPTAFPYPGGITVAPTSFYAYLSNIAGKILSEYDIGADRTLTASIRRRFSRNRVGIYDWLRWRPDADRHGGRGTRGRYQPWG